MVTANTLHIGIIGAGNIGARLVRKLSAEGHSVSVANSRGPETIPADLLSNGAHAATARDAVIHTDVVILSIPFGKIPALADQIGSSLARNTVVIDTSNYYPVRDGTVEAIEKGQIESAWVSERLGHPVVKAWNTVLFGTLDAKSLPRGKPGRLAIPVAADSREARQIGMRLVEDTGFDAFDAGAIAESWRIQPGAPAYCTELTLADMPKALANTVRAELPRRRDYALELIQKHGRSVTMDDIVRVNRGVFVDRVPPM